MPRDAGGSYTLPAGNPVVSGTVIQSTWANTTMDDIATEMTDSLSRTGNGAMLAPLRAINGTENAPSYTFTNDPLSGLYAVPAGEVRMTAQGVDAMRWTNNQTEIWNEADQEWYVVISARDNIADVETQTLTSGQLEVVWVNNIAGAAIFINGPDADNGRLVSGVDYTYDSGTQTLTLTESRPEGTLISAQRAGGFDPSTAVAPVLYDNEAALAAADLPLGTFATTKGQLTPGDGFGADWVVVSSQPLVGRDLDLVNGNVAVFQTDIVTKSGRKNYLINGDFSVWQRGTSFNVTNASARYSADRWYDQPFANLERNADQIAGLIHEFALRITAVGAGTYVVGQKVEGTNSLENRQVTVTFKVLVSATAANCSIRAFDGNNGSGSGGVQSFPFVPTGALQTVTATFTLGSHVDPIPAWNFQVKADLAAAEVIEIHESQVEVGQTATDFEYVDPALQLARCQRYLVDLAGDPVGANTPIAFGFTDNTTTISAIAKLPNTMRTNVPTLSVSSFSDFKFRPQGGGTSVPTNITLAAASKEAARLSFTIPSLGSGIQGEVLSNVAGGKLLLDAEL